MTTPTDRFAFPKPTDIDPADLPVQAGNIVEKIEDRLAYAGAQGGRKFTDAEEARTNTAYGLLGTNDKVSGLVLPNANDLIVVVFAAEIKSSAAAAGKAAIFVGSQQLNASSLLGEVATSGTNNYRQINACGGGLVSDTVDLGATAVDPTSGGGGPLSLSRSLGNSGWCVIGNMPAGTYDVSVQVKASSGSVSMAFRRLWAWTVEKPPTGT